jgi:short-subunit dehydrogenase involved in D-alanine esterification of teichoic acids
MKLTGNTILITGAGSGIGLALGEEFVKLDNRVIVAARSPEKLKVPRVRDWKPLRLICVKLEAFKLCRAK